MSSTAFFILGMMVGVVIGMVITLAHTEFEPPTNLLFLKRRARRKL